jgi:transitional endoplasmic reticulum ATPase
MFARHQPSHIMFCCLQTHRDPSGAEVKDVSITKRLSEAVFTDPPQKDETATAILKKKKKPNSLM